MSRLPRSPLARKTPLARAQRPLPRGKGIKPRSAKREAQDEDYRALVDEIVADALVCAVCRVNPPSDPHHLLPQSSGKGRMDPENIKAVCRPCHRYIDDHPAWAMANGWTKSRFRRG